MTGELHGKAETEILAKHRAGKIKRVTAFNISYQALANLKHHLGSLSIYFFLSWQLCAPTIAIADVYQFTADDGTQHFSDQPSDFRYRLMLLSGDQTSPSSFPAIKKKLLSSAGRRFSEEILFAARANRIEPALLHAVIEVESGYNPKAVSPKGAIGLMQLMPQTARRYAVVDPLDAVQNLEGGARLLRDLLNLFSDNKELALAAYNAGAGAVHAHGRHIPPYAETQRYVPTVLKRYEIHKGQATLRTEQQSN